MDPPQSLAAVLTTGSGASTQTTTPRPQQDAPSSTTYPSQPTYSPSARPSTSTPPPGSSAGNHRLRSSIACARCRRSKTKCTNAGAGTTCEACAHSGRECVYPSLGFGQPKRDSDSTEGLGDRIKRPRVRRNDHENSPLSAGYGYRDGIAGTGTGGRQQQRPTAFPLDRDSDPPPTPEAGSSAVVVTLDPRVLTPTVCNEVYELFTLHFGADLPFLHMPTFQPIVASAIPQLSSPTAVASNASPISTSTPAAGASDYSPRPGTTAAPQSWEILLLGILTLAARFHPKLVQCHASRVRQSLNSHYVGIETSTCEYYATALRAALFSDRGIVSIGPPTLPRIQALLMLAFHEWGCGKGTEAYQSVGLAVRGAQALGLHEEDKAPGPWEAMEVVWRRLWPLPSTYDSSDDGSKSKSEVTQDPDSAESFVDEETRRRTFWSCFILDRYLSGGRRRPSMIRTEDLALQLPCGEKAWAFGARTCTLGLEGKQTGMKELLKARRGLYRRLRGQRNSGSTRGDAIKQTAMNAEADKEAEMMIMDELGQDESLLSRVVRATEIWGWVAHWSCSGGLRSVSCHTESRSHTAIFAIDLLCSSNRSEDFSILDSHSRFQQLLNIIRSFSRTMPRALRLTKVNIQAHLAQRTSSPFTLLHTLHALSTMILHRSCLPFLPFHSSAPAGPPGYDASTYETTNRSPKIWAESSTELFDATHGVADLLTAYQPRKMLTETPIVGFTLYLVAFLGVYVLHFPHMDVVSHTSVTPPHMAPKVMNQLAAAKALTALVGMRDHLPLASDWIRTIHRLHQFYNDATSSPVGRILRHPDGIGNGVALMPSSAGAGISNGAKKANARLPLREHPPDEDTTNDLNALTSMLRALGDLDAHLSTKVNDHPDHSSSSIATTAPTPVVPTNDRTCPSRLSFTSSSDSSSKVPAAATARPAESWTAINSGVKAEPGTLPALPRTPESANQALCDSTPNDAADGPRPFSRSGLPAADKHSSYASRAALSASLPPLYQLAAAAEQDSQQQQQQQQRRQEQQQQQPRPPQGRHYAELAATARMSLSGDDVAAFIDGGPLEESGAIRGAGWRSEGWLAEIWKGQ